MAEQGFEPSPLTPKSALLVSRAFSWDQDSPVCPQGALPGTWISV